MAGGDEKSLWAGWTALACARCAGEQPGPARVRVQLAVLVLERVQRRRSGWMVVSLRRQRRLGQAARRRNADRRGVWDWNDTVSEPA